MSLFGCVRSQLRHEECCVQALECGLGSCCTKAQLLLGMWHLSSPTRDQTCVPCIGRQILNHWTTREESCALFFKVRFFQLITHGLGQKSAHFFCQGPSGEYFMFGNHIRSLLNILSVFGFFFTTLKNVKSILSW